MFVIQYGTHKMTSFLHDMTFHRENGRIRLLDTFKQTRMCLCMSDFGLRRPGVLKKTILFQFCSMFVLVIS